MQLLKKEKVLEQLTASKALEELGQLKQAKQEAEAYIKKLHSQKSYHKRKSEELQLQSDAQWLENEQQLSTLISKHEEAIEELLQSSTVKTHAGQGKLFTDTIRTVYYRLISLNVPTNRINEIIRTILGELAPSVTLGELPSRTTAA